MKRLLTLSTFLLLSIVTFADYVVTKEPDFEVDGIYYRIISATNAAVTAKSYQYTVVTPEEENNYFDYFHYDSGYEGNVVIPESVTYNNVSFSVVAIDDYTFRNGRRDLDDGSDYSCEIRSVYIPKTVNSLSALTFACCPKLDYIYVNWETPKNINQNVFSDTDCTKINLYVPQGTRDDYLAANVWKNFAHIVETTPQPTASGTCGANLTWAYYEGDKKLEISGTGDMDYYSVNTPAPWHSYNIKNVIIEEGVTSILTYAFSGCSGLTSITIPNSVTSIGNSAFTGCSGLTSITIPNSVTSIGNSAFKDCSGLTSITIPNSVTSIASFAFEYCSGLTSITIPNSVKRIGSGAFEYCLGLTSIKVQEGNTKYDSRNNCNAIIETASNTLIRGCKNTVIPNSVKSIGQYAFYGCSGLTSITIPNSVASIGQYAFYGCSGLTSITIPNSVKSIGLCAFYGCSGLTSITIPNSVASIGRGAFEGCTGLETVTNNSSISIIEDRTFYGCSGLTSINIPSNVTSIGQLAFCDCSGLTSITIPNSVKSIGLCAFGGCSGLVAIYSYIENPTSASGVEFDNYTNATLYVLKGKKNKYLATDGWNNFVKITEFAPTYTLTYKVDDETYKTYQVEYGTTIVPEPAPTKEGYSFSGWSGIPATMPANDVTVTGTFTINKYNLTYKVDGVTYKQYEVAEGDIITPEPAPTRDGYTFSGWSEIPATMPASDVTVTGTFTAIPVPEPSSDNALAISNAETYAGKQIVLPIDMNNVASIKAFQFDLYLPEGITIAKDEDEEELIELTSRAAKSHTIAYSNRPDGAIRMVCTSMSGATFKGNEGAIVNVTLDVAPSMTDGDYDIEIKNIELSDGTPYNPADIKATLTVKTYTPGDVDGTGTVSVNDAVCVINYILGSPAEDFIEPAADLDGNGVITVNDVVILINDYILGGNSQNSFDLAFLQDVTADDDYLYIEEDNLSNMTAGEEREIEVFMNTSRADIQGLQCDIYLPDGMEFVPEEDGDEKYYADKGGRAAKSHSVAAQLMADGSVRVVETSTSGAKFKANELAVFYFTVRATANTAYGQGIRLCNMELSYGGAPINPEDRTFDVKVKAGTVSLNSEGYATFSHASDVEVEGAEVYTATRNGNIISCTKEEQSVAAFNGVILKGEPDATVTLYTNNGVEGYTGNELKPTTTAAGVADIETALVLSGNMFKNYTGAAFVADKAYMPYDGNSANAIEMVFDDATAINSIASENNLLDGAVIKTVEDGKLVIKTANGKYSSVGAKMK